MPTGAAVAATSERLLGAAHEDTLLAATRLASAALAAGDGADAVAIYQRVLETQGGQLGPDHPRMVAARADYGTVLLRVGQPAESIVILEGVLAVGDRDRGVIDVLAISDSLAAAYQAAGRHQEAIRTALATLAERERRQGPDEPADHPHPAHPGARLPGRGQDQGRDRARRRAPSAPSGCSDPTTPTPWTR